MAVTDAPAVRRAIEQSADADAARVGIERLTEAQPDAVDALAAGGGVLDAVVAIATASHSLLAALIQDRAAMAVLADRAALLRPAGDDDYRRLLADVTGSDDPPAELRHRKRRSLVRIAARDLLGIADLPATALELAALAQACIAAALEIAEPTVSMAVIGMGKLGGRELNYASDVDVMFVHDGSSRDAEYAAQAVLRTMSNQTADGIVFRTDADLRPEGRSGALSRALDAYTAYWDRWAQAWEFQALLKARGVAGDEALATRFLSEAEQRVFPDVARPDVVREIRRDEGPKRIGPAPARPRRTRGEARARRHPRHRVLGAAPPTRARAHRRPYPHADDARRAGGARRRRIRVAGRRRSTARRLRMAAYRRAPTAARRRTADPHPPGRR